MKKTKITFFALLSALLVAPAASQASPQGIYAGEQASVLLEKDFQIDNAMRPLNPVVLELKMVENGQELGEGAFDAEGVARLSQNGETSLLSLRCGDSYAELADEASEQVLGEVKTDGQFCLPENRTFFVERGVEGKLRAELAVNTSWRLQTGSYSVKAYLHPVGIVPQEKASRARVLEGEAELMVSDIAVYREKPEQTLYYANIRKERDQTPVVEFSGSEGLELKRCLATPEGCTWKTVETTEKEVLKSEIRYEGLYAVVQRDFEEGSSESPAQGGSPGSNEVTASDQIIEEETEKVGDPVNLRSEVYPGQQLRLNGDLAPAYEGKSSFRPLDPGEWELEVEKENGSAVEDRVVVEPEADPGDTGSRPVEGFEVPVATVRQVIAGISEFLGGIGVPLL